MSNSRSESALPEERPVLVIAAPWRERALLVAELQERGCDVRALPGIVYAIGYLVRRPHVRPAVVVVDVAEDPDISSRTVRDLLQLTEPSPWVVILPSTRKVEPDLVSSPRIRRMKRPVSIGEVVETVLTLLQEEGEAP